MPLELFILGPLRVKIDEHLHLLTGTQAALIGYLALQHHSGHAAARSRLAGTLWPETTEERARQLLSNTLYRLQKHYPQLASHLDLTADTAALKDVWIDAHRFRKLVQNSTITKQLDAIHLYQGPLLDDLDEEWLLGERALLHDLYLETLSTCCLTLEKEPTSARSAAEALLLAQRWVQADPLSEAAHVHLMRHYLRVGRRHAAWHQYQLLQEQLVRELGVEPSPETAAFGESLRPVPHTEPALPPPLFVGRDREVDLLTGGIDRLLQHSGGFFLVTGEPGIGKTTLLNQACRAAGWRQITTAYACCHPDGQPLLFDPLSPLAHELATQPHLRREVDTLSPLLKRLLAPLVSLTGDESSPPPSTFTPLPTLAAAIHHLFERWLSHGPLALFLDDVQWADPQFWRILPQLAALTRSAPLVLVLAYRPWELRQRLDGGEALAVLENEQATVIHLESFTPAECSALTEAVAPDLAPSTPQLMQLSGGNPLLLRELLARPEQRVGELTPLLAARLDHLSPTAREALSAAAAIGNTFDYETWCAACGQTVSGLALGELIASRFVAEDDDRFRFQHDLVRLFLYQQLADDARKAIHGRIADSWRRAGRSPEILAWHCEAAGRPNEALAYYAQAAERALVQKALQSAEALLTHALQLSNLQSPPSPLHLPLRALYLRLRHQQQPTAEALPEIERLMAEARTLYDIDAELQLLLLVFDLQAGQGKLARLAPLTEQILALTPRCSSRPLEIEALQQLAIKTAFTIGDADQAVHYALQAVAVAEGSGERPDLLVEARLSLSACYLARRQLEEGQAMLATVAQQIAADPSLAIFEADRLYFEAIAAQFSGEWDKTYAIQQQAVETHRQNGNFYALTTALYNAANVASSQGDHEQAILYGLELVQLAEEVLAETDVEKRLRYRTRLATAHEAAGEYDAAEAALAPVYEWLVAHGQGAAAVYGWSALGRIYAGQGRFEASYTAHARAMALSEGLGAISPPPFLHHAEICYRTGRLAEGRASLEEGESRMTENSSSKPLASYLRYLYDKKTDDLLRAYDNMISQAERFADPHTRQSFLNRLDTHRKIRQALSSYRPLPITVKLVRDDVPLGRPLTEGDYVTVQWQVDDGLLDARVLKFRGAVAQRLQRLARLMAEARAQGGVPTIADLARAMAVSERTVERDIKRLKSAGEAIHTRRHRGD